jgi:hypothetical protein
MRPLLFNIATSSSFVLCAATAALWARSYRQCEMLYWETSSHEHFLASTSGEIIFGTTEGTNGREAFWRSDPAPPYGNASILGTVIGFAWRAGPNDRHWDHGPVRGLWGPGYAIVFLDYLGVVLVLLVIPIVGLIRSLRRKRRAQCSRGAFALIDDLLAERPQPSRRPQSSQNAGSSTAAGS